MDERVAVHVNFDTLSKWVLKQPMSEEAYAVASFQPVIRASSTRVCAEPSFEAFSDCELRIAAGAFYEDTWAKTSGQTSYIGTSVLLPVRQTYNESNKVYKDYACAMSLSKESHENPPLRKGDHVNIWMSNDDPEVDIPWSGTVCKRFSWSGLDAVCLFIKRPMAEGTILDLHAVHHLDLAEVERWSLAEFREQATKAQSNRMKVQLITDDKELKRKLRAVSMMRFTPTMTVSDSERAESLKPSQSMFMCNDYSSLPTSGLYDKVDIKNEQLQYVASRLHPDQLNVYKELVDRGMRNKSAFITGISGAGKSYLQRTLQLPFLNKVQTSNIRNILRNIDLRKPSMGPDNLRPSFVQLSDASHDPNGIIMEKGRSLYVAATNHTADSLYKSVSSAAAKYNATMGSGPPLVYRRYATHTEIAAVKASLHPDFKQDGNLPNTFEQQMPAIAGSNNQAASNAYLAFQSDSIYRDIHDARFTDWKSSMAFHVHNLSLQDRHQDVRLRTAFTNEERDILRGILDLFPRVRDHLAENGGLWTDELHEEVEKACRKAFNWLDFKADIVICTTSAATEEDFALYRQPHFIGIEEVGRLDDATLMAFWSIYHSAVARVCVGDHRQIGVQIFSDKRENPIYLQTEYSFLKRAIATGFRVPDLITTHRFANEELLDLVRIINQNDAIRMRDGAALEEKSNLIRKVHDSILPGLEVGTTIVYINAQGTEQDCRKSLSGSIFNISTAVITVNTVFELIRSGVSSADIVITSAYRTQTELHRTLVAAFSKDVSPAAGKAIAGVQCFTIDSYMGEESPDHVHDSCYRTGHTYHEPTRAVVLYSRGKHGFMLIGSNDALISRKDRFDFDHPCKQVVRHLNKSGRYVNLPHGYASKANKFQKTIDALGPLVRPL